MLESIQKRWFGGANVTLPASGSVGNMNVAVEKVEIRGEYVSCEDVFGGPLCWDR